MTKVIDCERLPASARTLVRQTRDAVVAEWSRRAGETVEQGLAEACAVVADDMNGRYTCTGERPTMPVSGEDLLGIADLKFYQDDKDGRSRAGMHLHRDGRLEVFSVQDADPSRWAWEDAGWVVADGTVYYVTQRVDHVLPDGRFQGAVLRSDALVVRGKPVTIDDRGVVLVDGREGVPRTRVEGTTTAMTKRTALAVIKRFIDVDVFDVQNCSRACRNFGLMFRPY
jgi:hypothetical protein